MTQEELLEKAIDTTDMLAGGLLNPEQSDKFIDFVVDQSVMIKDARVVRLRARKGEISKIGISGRVSVPKEEGVDPGVRREITFGKVELDTAAIMTPFEITDEALEDSVEGGNLEDAVIRVMASQTATDLEELAIQCDEGSGDSFLALADGWRILAEDGHVVDHGGAAVSKALFSNMVKALPDQYKKDWGALRFYVAPIIAQDYRDLITEGSTVAADKFLLENMPLTVFGIPVVSVPMIPTDETGVLSVSSGVEDLSYAFLTPKTNLVYGVHREITIDKDKDIYRGVRQYAITTRVACELEEDDAVVLAVNVAQAS